MWAEGSLRDRLSLRYSLFLPMETPSNNVLKGMHFHMYKKVRRDWRFLVQAALVGQPKFEPISNAFLAINRCCSGGGLDWDNAYGGLKPLLDCLVVATPRNPDGLGLLVDDNPRNMPMPPYLTQGSAKPSKGFTKLFIYEIFEDSSSD